MALIFLSSGVEIDAQNKKVRKYFSIGFMRFGKWYDLDNISRIALKFNNHKSPSYRLIYLAKAPSTFLTFDIHLTDYEIDKYYAKRGK